MVMILGEVILVLSCNIPVYVLRKFWEVTVGPLMVKMLMLMKMKYVTSIFYWRVHNQ